MFIQLSSVLPVVKLSTVHLKVMPLIVFTFVPEEGQYRGRSETLHSFRSGSAITLAIISHVGWKNKQTAALLSLDFGGFAAWCSV